MSGIIFLKTKNLEEIRKFYLHEIGMEVWLEQPNISILKHGNLILGLHETEEIDRFGLITFFYSTKEKVNEMYQKFKKVATTEPKINEKYNIYNFFAKDPEGRKLEFQAFLHPVEPFMDGKEALITRRSIRAFLDNEVPEEVLWKLFEVCRYSPTSRNSQSYYFVVVKDREKINFLASLRDGSSQPIAEAPLAVAICGDPEKTKRPDQDSCIAAYHFCVAAHLYGLGTCWIAAMDRDEAKECLGIPKEHYIATITPLGYPKETKSIPERRKPEEFVTFR